jgi:hypothetical protein
VAPRHLFELAALGEFIESVSARCLEQSIIHRRAGAIRNDERFLHQIRNMVDPIRCADLRAGDHRTRCLQGKAAGEDSQAAQDRAFRLGEKLVAPVECGPKRLLPRQRRAAAPSQQPEAIVQPRSQSFKPERSRAGSRQFDGERHTVEPPAYCRNCCCSATIQRKVRVRIAGPGNKQASSTMSQHLVRVLCTFRGHTERQHPIDALARYSQWFAAGGYHTRPRVGARQRLGHACRRIDDMLAIVEHEKQPLRPECIGYTLR